MENANRVISYDEILPVKVRMRPRPTFHTQDRHKFKRVFSLTIADDLAI